MSEELQGHGDTVFSVCVTADGKRAVSGSRDETLRFWTPSLKASASGGATPALKMSPAKIRERHRNGNSPRSKIA